jgi:hypothetical protein
MQLFPETYCSTLPNSWEVEEICKRRGVYMQGKGAAALPGRQHRQQRDFALSNPESQYRSMIWLGALIISCGRTLSQWPVLCTVLAQGLWSSGLSPYGM